MYKRQTSTNAKQIVESFPKDEKIIFGPDRNLGNYINSVTGRSMLLWDGACHVHEQFSVEKIVELKAQHPDAVVLAHPECKSVVLKLAPTVAGDDIFVEEGGKLTFSVTNAGTGDTLNDCGDKIDGWYTDANGQRRCL